MAHVSAVLEAFEAFEAAMALPHLLQKQEPLNEEAKQKFIEMTSQVGSSGICHLHLQRIQLPVYLIYICLFVSSCL